VGRLTGLTIDEFEHAMRGVEGRYIPVRKSTGDWHIRHIALDGFELMVGYNGGGSIYQGACGPGNAGLFFPLSEGGSVLVNGEQANVSTLSWLATSRDFHVYNSDAMAWMGVSIDCETVAHWLDLTHEDFRPAIQQHLLAPVGDARVERLKGLINRIFEVCDAGEDVLQGAAPRTVSSQLSWAIYEAVQSMTFEKQVAQGRPRLSRGKILDRTLQLLEAAGSEPVQILDLCRASDVSSRTLHAVFNEHFGISPYRFLVLQRIRNIHDALRDAGDEETVAGICARFGVWDFGRFSGLYKRIYGVHPSAAMAKKSPSRANKPLQ